MISKLHETTRKDAEAKKKKAKGPNILWVNAEEEAIAEVVTYIFIVSSNLIIY